MRCRRDLADVQLLGAGGCLSVDNGHQLVFLLLQRQLDFLNLEDLSERTLDAVDDGPLPFCNFGQASAEVSMDARQHLVSRLQQVREGGLHSGCARSG